MRINRLALIKAIDAAQTAHRAQWERSEEKRIAQAGKELEAWRARFANAWADAALKIRKVLREGGSVSRDMLPLEPGYGSQVAVHSPYDPDRYAYQAPRELDSLRIILHTIEDDAVTIAALERLGMTRQTIRCACQYLQAATIQGASD